MNVVFGLVHDVISRHFFQHPLLFVLLLIAIIQVDTVSFLQLLLHPSFLSILCKQDCCFSFRFADHLLC